MEIIILKQRHFSFSSDEINVNLKLKLMMNLSNIFEAIPEQCYLPNFTRKIFRKKVIIKLLNFNGKILLFASALCIKIICPNY